MKHYLRTLLVALVAVMLLVSCKSKEERVLDRLQTMSEQIQKNGDNFSKEDWEKLYKEYSDIHAKILNKEYNFTDEQMRELGKLEGKIGKAFVKHSMSDFGKAADELIKKGSEFLKGILESDEDKEE
ncbi:MAG: hypothetical protein IKX25_12515 [Bacteroidales bacterium]|nr:hypothetical protein [Bacteroidales bacterium]